MNKIDYDFLPVGDISMSEAFAKIVEMGEAGFRPGGVVEVKDIRPFIGLDTNPQSTTYIANEKLLVFWREADSDVLETDVVELRDEVRELRQQLEDSHIERGRLVARLERFNDGTLMETLRSYAQFARFFHEITRLIEPGRLSMPIRGSVLRTMEAAAARHGLIQGDDRGGYRLTKVGQMQGEIPVIKVSSKTKED